MNAQRERLVFLGVFLLVSGVLAAIVWFGKAGSLLGFLWSPPFLLAVKILCGLALLLAVLRWFGQALPRNVLQWVYGLVFLPVLLLPLLHCYFKVPYVFCRVCPNRCLWGTLRSWVFTSFVLLNLPGTFWCAMLCPFGTIQRSQAGLSKMTFGLPRWAAVLAPTVLVLVAGMYLLTWLGPRSTEFFDLGRYMWVEVTAWVTLGILVFSFFIPKFFCRYFCPVGCIAEFTSKLKAGK